MVTKLAFWCLLLVLLLASASAGTQRSQESIFNGFCGNHFFEGNRTVISKSLEVSSGIYPFNGDLYAQRGVTQSLSISRQSNDMVERLKKEPIIVRLNVVYDKSMKNEHGNIQNYIRNLIFATQLIYEQREIYERVRIQLVVKSIKQAEEEYLENLDVDGVLSAFSRGSDGDHTSVDLNILLTFRNSWLLLNSGGSDRPKTRKILGVAYMDTFCSRGSEKRPAFLILGAPNLGGAALTLAHEMGHAFNVPHDGLPQSTSSKCNPEDNIMSPSAGPYKTTWSKCSVDTIVNHFANHLGSCIYDKNRLDNAKPFNSLFDFEIRQGNSNRDLLPGMDTDIDQQCSKALSKQATSSLKLTGKNGNTYFETCQSLYCSLGNRYELSIGPAPIGSTCTVGNGAETGKCFYGRCVPSK